MANQSSRRAKIIKSLVDRVPLPTAGSTLIWDTLIPGFALRVRPSGSKSYVYKYRVGARQRWLDLGRHGIELTTEEARAKALAAASQVNAGEDPQLAKEARRKAMFVDELAKLYLVEGRASKPDKRESSWSTDESRLRRHVLPLIGKMRLLDLTRRDVERMQAKIAAGGTSADERTGRRGRAIVRGGALVAAGCVTTLSAMLNWAKARQLIPENPALGVKKAQPTRRERFLSTAEARNLLATLSDLAERRVIPESHASILRVLIFTGARKSEILGLRWNEVDFERRQIRLPRLRSKTGERTITLNAPAVAELARAPQVSAFVFPSLKGGEGHTVGLHKTWRTVRVEANLDDVRIHDLRHSFASFAADHGESLQVIGKALGHRQAQTTERYAHLTDDPVRRLADRVGERLARG
ncbi:tyrosine-type recombinase/integrase [Terricaulis sp.]|uniref:tyrosine-type recombinase/integrase n=1 Tax=Terricaulis sp. TaxID=2768686 RepID=UPI0037844690